MTFRPAFARVLLFPLVGTAIHHHHLLTARRADDTRGRLHRNRTRGRRTATLNIAAYHCAGGTTDAGTGNRAGRAADGLPDCRPSAAADRAADNRAGPSFTTPGGDGSSCTTADRASDNRTTGPAHRLADCRACRAAHARANCSLEILSRCARRCHHDKRDSGNNS